MRIVTYNIGEQELSEKIMSALETLEADVILLQEVEERTLEKTKDIATKFGYESVYAAARESRKTGTHGLAILSRHRIGNVEVQQLPFIKMNYNPRERIALHASIMFESETINVCNVHLDTRLSLLERIYQLSPILKKLSHPAILGGDFNTIPFKFFRNFWPIGMLSQRKHIDKHLVAQGYNLFAGRLGRSHRLVPWQLDAIYTLGVDILNYGIARNIKLSDHFPVWADIQTASY